jgi:hypothetical protein
MPSVLPVQAISRGGATRRIVEVTVPGPAFQREHGAGADVSLHAHRFDGRF